MKKTPNPKDKILKIFTKLVEAKRMTPNRAELHNAGITIDMYRHHFKTIQGLREAAQEKYPEVFKDLIDEKIFTPKFLKQLRANTKKYKKFIITTAVTGMPVHKDFYTNLKFYCEKNNAKLLILASSDPAAIGGFELDGALHNESIVVEDLELNSNLFISTFKTSAKQINPLTGIKRIGQRERSLIVASPKQFLEYVPIANDKMSHAIMTTGALTLPTYRTERYMSQRTAYIAEFDHKMGAIVVDIIDNKLFHMTQIQAEYGTGFFVDRGAYYQLNKVTKISPEGLILGDWHTGSTDQAVRKATIDMINKLKPKRVFLHDFFDGISVNHHMAESFLTKGMLNPDQLSLEMELKACSNELNSLKKACPNVQEWIVVRSNHDDFIDRYLNGGDYIEDARNHILGLELSIAKSKGEIPLEAGMLQFGLKPDKVRFLRLNDSYKISGIEHGVHGHLGMNGQRNPANGSLEIAYGAGTFGHSHSPGILRDVFRVGTSTVMRMGYNNGASSWMNTHGITYHNGSRQLINIINGAWC